MWWRTADYGMCGRGHHLIRNPIRFLFVDVTRVVDRELGLQTRSPLLPALRAFARHVSRASARAFALQDCAVAGAQSHRTDG
jgi:hypothetical protein